jgi:DNA-directed RNA polymerase subunit F
MEVKITNAGYLTNIEVLDLINERKLNRSKRQDQDKHNITLIETEVSRYFQVHDKEKYTSNDIKAMLSNVKKLNLDLKETELLSIANLIPTKIVELHVCIDDIENRLKDTDITNLLDVIKQSLNIKDDEDNEDNEDNMDES